MALGNGNFSVVGADMIITGSIKASADLHIDGRIDGDVICATLAQGADGRIHGTATADTARLAGTVEGGVHVKQLTVERGARITGDVDYEHITIEHGGHVHGRLNHMSRAAAAAPSTPTGLRPVETTPSGEAANN